MKALMKILLAILLCFPLTLSAQWTDYGTYIRTNDKVGIGVNPAAKLAVSSSQNQRGIESLSPNGNTHLPWSNGWSYISGLGLVFRTNGNTERMRIVSNGNVGIGTTNPGSKLTVVSATNQGGIQSSSPHGVTALPWSNGWSYISGVGVIFRTNGNTERVRIVSNGNVGIGTTTPDNKLDVNGTIRAKEIKVESGWSDYVFYNDYQLPTLEEEEKHIEAKGHLLGFESEQDMEGMIHLGDVSRRQQAKIEEIILHLIDMKKEMTELREENEELKKLLKTGKE